jgi:hypothetical protein
VGRSFPADGVERGREEFLREYSPLVSAFFRRGEASGVTKIEARQGETEEEGREEAKRVVLDAAPKPFLPREGEERNLYDKGSSIFGVLFSPLLLWHSLEEGEWAAASTSAAEAKPSTYRQSLTRAKPGPKAPGTPPFFSPSSLV